MKSAVVCFGLILVMSVGANFDQEGESELIKSFRKELKNKMQAEAESDRFVRKYFEERRAELDNGSKTMPKPLISQKTKESVIHKICGKQRIMETIEFTCGGLDKINLLKHAPFVLGSHYLKNVHNYCCKDGCTLSYLQGLYC
ncbi:hypothetical protein L596_010617 [Steinernema carpocapsae]|uniref:Insulin-like domain-containing protein n=1 Tax=Steinernema carpocapsae TaxID=34508 RepID=A0A4U5PIV2_STECR|nr:hypothetical protein L596_010617 [Steinernema carpocapsae]